jgi:hypothetical protein
MSVIFDQLRIADDGKKMYINLHVNKAEYFNDIYLDSITIITADKVSETNPDIPTSDYIYNKVFEDNQKEADLVLLPSDFNEHFTKSNFSSDLFFVFVKIKGTPSECTPCRLDEEVTLGVTFDESLLYQRVMDFTKDLTDDCQIPTEFTDFILLWNAFKASVETEHYVPAIKLWKMLFDNRGSVAMDKSKNCGCHG